MVGVLTRLICGPTRRNLADAAAIGIFFWPRKRKRERSEVKGCRPKAKPPARRGRCWPTPRKSAILKKLAKKPPRKVKNLDQRWPRSTAGTRKRSPNSRTFWKRSNTAHSFMVLEGSFLFQVSENQQQINTFVEEKQRNVSCPFMSLVFDQT